MGKKRRTKKQKIIAKLRRQLEQKTNQQLEKAVNQPDLTSKITEPKITKPAAVRPIKAKEKGHFFSYDPQLIKKSLIKTLVLSIIFCLLIFLLFYLIEIKKILPL